MFVIIAIREASDRIRKFLRDEGLEECSWTFRYGCYEGSYILTDGKSFWQNGPVSSEVLCEDTNVLLCKDEDSFKKEVLKFTKK